MKTIHKPEEWESKIMAEVLNNISAKWLWHDKAKTAFDNFVLRCLEKNVSENSIMQEALRFFCLTENYGNILLQRAKNLLQVSEPVL